MSYTPNNPKYGPLPPWRISAERFNELLNVLPPGRHQYGASVETFFLIERLSGDIVMWVVRACNPKDGTPLYFCFNGEATMSVGDLRRTVWLAMDQAAGGTLPESEEAVLAALQ